MNARVALSLVWLVVLSGCSVHFYAGTGTAPTHEERETRRSTRRYRVSYRTQETTPPQSIQDEDDQKAAAFHTHKGKRVVVGKDATSAGQGVGNGSTGSTSNGGQPVDPQTGGQAAQPEQPVTAQPATDTTADDDTVEGRKRKHVLTDQERIAELAEQKKEELRRKEQARKERVKRAAEAAASQQP